MRAAVVLPFVVALASSGTPASAAGGPPQLSEDEAEACRSELEVLDRRRKIFEAQGLSPAEVARRNESEARELTDCRARFRASARRSLEEKQDLEEVERRVGPNATPLEREKAFHEVRRERLASKSPSALTPEEKEELAAGMQEEMAATHALLDETHSRDPSFMRIVHSAVTCFHGERRQELLDRISSEESLLKVGAGDRQALYSLRSDLRETEQVLARSREASRGYALGLERCTSPTIAVLAHCMGVRFLGKPQEPACESEEIQQYVRLVK